METRIIKGYGSRKNRVHVFDENGCFICSGYIRDKILYIEKTDTGITSKTKIVIRKWRGRRE